MVAVGRMSVALSAVCVVRKSAIQRNTFHFSALRVLHYSLVRHKRNPLNLEAAAEVVRVDANFLLISSGSAVGT